VYALVFTAGIRENSAMIREHVCRNLAAFDLVLDETKNEASKLGKGPTEIQTVDSKTNILVIPTDEERSIAEQTYEIALRP
jgi:acetate kinase